MPRRQDWLTARVRPWLEKREAALALKKCGGDQRCPWCRQWMNQFTATHCRPFGDDEMLDELTCGHCFGSSIWKWEIGFIFVTAGEPPTSCLQKSDFDDSPFLREVVRRTRASLSGRAVRRAEFRDEVGWMLGPPPPAKPTADDRPTEGSGVLSLAPDTEIPSASGSEQQ